MKESRGASKKQPALNESPRTVSLKRNLRHRHWHCRHRLLRLSFLFLLLLRHRHRRRRHLLYRCRRRRRRRCQGLRDLEWQSQKDQLCLDWRRLSKNLRKVSQWTPVVLQVQGVLWFQSEPPFLPPPLKCPPPSFLYTPATGIHSRTASIFTAVINFTSDFRRSAQGGRHEIRTPARGLHCSFIENW